MKKFFTFTSLACDYNGFMATAEQVAHILRRTGFSVRPGQVQPLLDTDVHDLIDQRLADEGWALPAEEAARRTFDDDSNWKTLPLEWMNQMMTPEAGLHERMVWFWHNHFTTNKNETTDILMWRQHHLVRRHALGNFRTLAREIITDGAMLHFLDGSGSRGEAPNENFSREFLEIFMLGRNSGYTEDDVRAGARILTGWSVKWDTGEIEFETERHYNRPVRFLDQRRRWNLDSYVEAVLAQPACAPYVAGKIHDYLVSTPLSDERREELGAVLVANDWEIRPLLHAMLHHDDFVNALGRRTRQPVEWLASAAAVFELTELDKDGLEYWQLDQTGQVPFHPPNVAGWADDDRWSSATQVMVRGNAIMHWEVSERIINRIVPTPQAVLAHCGIFAPTDETLAALEQAIAAQTEYDRGLELLLTLAVLSPDFAVL